MSKTVLVAAFAATTLLIPARGAGFDSFLPPQEVKPPVEMPNVTGQESGTPQEPATLEPITLEPLVFDPPLPEDPVAWVNGEPIPKSALLRLVLEQNFNSGVSSLVMAKVLEIELQNADETVTKEEEEAELRELLATSAPGKTLESLIEEGQTSIKHLRLQARTNRGWKKLFWANNKIPVDQRTEQTNQLMMQFFMSQVMERYDRRIRGQNPPPSTGHLAQVIEKATGKEITIGASEALDYLMGLVKQSGLLDARNEVVQAAILQQAADAKDVSVSDEEVANWAAAMRQKNQGLFGWDQINRLKGTTSEQEMDRWRRVQIWKRVTGTEPTEAELLAFVEENIGWFLGEMKKVSHILIRTTDEITGQPYDQAKQAEAEKLIREMHTKLEEGVDFGWMAETYSDDLVTARGRGRLAQGIKKWGGNLDPAFQNAVWTLTEIGELSPPVKSQYGWHLIKLDEITPARPKEQSPDWSSPSYLDWIRDEYETRLMKEFLGRMKAKADVKLVPDSEILALKHKSYWHRSDSPR